MTLLHQAAQKAVLTDKQIQDAVFVVLRRWNTDRAWDRYTRESGPYDVTSLRPEVLEIIRAVLAIVPPALQHQEVPREQRAGFESWAARTLGIGNFGRAEDEDGDYMNPDTDDLWRCWQEATDTEKEEPREPVAVARPLTSEEEENAWNTITEQGCSCCTAAVRLFCRLNGITLSDAVLATSPSTTRQQEVGSDDEWKQEAATVLARFIHLSAQPVVEEWAQTASAAIRLLNDPAGLAAAPSTPEKAGGVSDGVGACPGCGRFYPVHLPGCPHVVSAPVSHPLPAQANDGGEHG